MHFRQSLHILGAALALTGGCAGWSTSVSTGYRASYSSPDLVYVEPGVQVIADYDEPIFYADNFYWRYSGGSWYRSPYHTGGWSFAVPPPAILRIDRPYAYRHYRPSGWTPRRQVVGPPPSYDQGRRSYDHDRRSYDHDRRRGYVAQPPTYAPPPQSRPPHVAPVRPQFSSPPPQTPLPSRAYDTYRGRSVAPSAPARPQQRVAPPQTPPVQYRPATPITPPPPSLPGRQRP
jgi:hypothetical protein